MQAVWQCCTHMGILFLCQAARAAIAALCGDRHELVLPMTIADLIGPDLRQLDAEGLGVKTLLLLAGHFARMAASAQAVVDGK